VAFCANCGTELSDQAPACPKCGHPRIAPRVHQTDSGAIISLILGILGIIACPLVLSIPAVIVGNRARANIRQDPNLEGESMARAGVILGWVGIGFAAVGIVVAVLALLFVRNSGYSDPFQNAIATIG
jgi:uncharacterized protein DUF4190/zinc ribbon protein